ncbi:thioredoxin domain-containing protein [Mycolicibacterium arseniciresistens]|uniref:Alkylmercury lyase n=1 Tax=Mycolicibacterium arseniciresistens TaxID=3062257 RepID=A0ABT8U9V9_9MYCO|nr:alkylmercury lyase [Mycolicibacterium arseniciresistens]MDO3634583.1 alkylmercury lyase [Mycolicibacterium arseniciresistens]
MRIELLTAPGCPNAAAAKKVIIECLADLGIEAPIRDRIGAYSSPTVLIDGIDVMRGDAPPVGEACRLDLPTPQRVRDALHAHASSNTGRPDRG